MTKRKNPRVAHGNVSAKEEYYQLLLEMQRTCTDRGLSFYNEMIDVVDRWLRELDTRKAHDDED